MQYAAAKSPCIDNRRGIRHRIGHGEAISAEGAQVVIADLNDQQASAVVEDSGGKFGKTIGDVSKLADAERMVNEAASQMGGLDILINNAGIETIGLGDYG